MPGSDQVVIDLSTGVADVAGGTQGHAERQVLGLVQAVPFGLVAAVGVTAGCVVAVLVWRMLPGFPAGVVRSDSARAGTTLMAAAFLNVPLLTWIAEDSHWRGRLLASRPWPRPFGLSGLAGCGLSLSGADAPGFATFGL